MARKKILFVCEAVTNAHVTRPLVLAGALDPGRYEIMIAGASSCEKYFSGRGWSFYPLPTITPQEFTSDLDNMRSPYTEERLTGYVAAELGLFKNIRPDVVVGDFRLSLGISCDVMRIPFLNLLTNAHWSPYYSGDYVLPDFGFVRLLGERLAHKIFSIVKNQAFRWQARGFNRLRRRYGLQGLTNILDVYAYGTMTAYPDIPSLTPVLNCPAQHVFIGPVLYQPDVPLPEWWDRLPADRPVVYLTMGSSGDPAMYGMILDILRKMPVSVCIATAGLTRAATQEGNIFFSEYLPGMDLCQRASLLISNGGSASSYQALYHGKPVLAFPRNMDQSLFTYQLVRAGAGLSLRAAVRTRERIKAAVIRLLEDRVIRDNCVRIGEEVRKIDARDNFCRLLERLIALGWHNSG